MDKQTAVCDKTRLAGHKWCFNIWKFLVWAKKSFIQHSTNDRHTKPWKYYHGGWATCISLLRLANPMIPIHFRNFLTCCLWASKIKAHQNGQSRCKFLQWKDFCWMMNTWNSSVSWNTNKGSQSRTSVTGWGRDTCTVAKGILGDSLSSNCH